MPDRKIITVLVICIALIISVWLFQRARNDTPVRQKVDSLSVIKNQNKIETNEDWKKLLTAVDRSKASYDFAKTSNIYTEDDTLTGQMARDMLSKYLILSRGGTPPTETDLSKMTEDILSSPVYTSSTGAIYYKTNLKITNQTDREVVLLYNKILSTRLGEIDKSEKIDAMTVFSNFIKSDDKSELTKLDPVILRYQSIVKFLINTTVPFDAADLHLELLNVYSNLLTNIKDIRSSDNDPVRGLVGVTKYLENINQLKYMLAKINLYFQKKLK